MGKGDQDVFALEPEFAQEVVPDLALVFKLAPHAAVERDEELCCTIAGADRERREQDRTMHAFRHIPVCSAPVPGADAHGRSNVSSRHAHCGGEVWHRRAGTNVCGGHALFSLSRHTTGADTDAQLSCCP